jgi:hypothetical protein
MTKVVGADKLDKTEISVAQRACTVMLYEPGDAHVCEAVVVPTASQPELLPSPQLN